MDEKFSDFVKRIDNGETENYSKRLRLVVSELDRLNTQWENFAEWARIYGHPSWCNCRERVPSPCHCGLEDALVEIPREYVNEYETENEDD